MTRLTPAAAATRNNAIRWARSDMWSPSLDPRPSKSKTHSVSPELLAVLARLPVARGVLREAYPCVERAAQCRALARECLTGPSPGAQSRGEHDRAAHESRPAARGLRDARRRALAVQPPPAVRQLRRPEARAARRGDERARVVSSPIEQGSSPGQPAAKAAQQHS